MMHTDRLKRHPGTFRQLTGLTPAKFDHLLADLAPRYRQADARRKSRPGRKRKPGAGRKHALRLADRLLMLLMYYRTYTTHAFLGFLFGVDDSAVGRNINPLQPLLAGIFRIPERRVAVAAGNRRVSRRRIAVEHGIGKMKVWRIAAERYRNPRRRHTLVMKNVAGLHNRMFA